MPPVLHSLNVQRLPNSLGKLSFNKFQYIQQYEEGFEQLQRRQNVCLARYVYINFTWSTPIGKKERKI